MKHLRLYTDTSAFTEPTEVVDKKIGIYLLGDEEPLFLDAIDNGDGTYTIAVPPPDEYNVVLSDGFGFYWALDDTHILKITTASTVSGELEEDPFYHYSGYTGTISYNGQTANVYVLTFEEINEEYGVEVWNISEEIGLDAELCIYLKEWEIKEERQNTITTTSDIHCVNYFDNSIFPVKVRKNGNGTYTEILEGGQDGLTIPGDGVYVISHQPGNSSIDNITFDSRRVNFIYADLDFSGYRYTCDNPTIPSGVCGWSSEEGPEKKTTPGRLFSLTEGTLAPLNKYAIKTVISHTQKGGTDYQFLIERPGVGYIRGIKKVAYQKKPVKTIPIYITGTTTLAFELPVTGNSLTVTQEQLRKLSCTILPGYQGGDNCWAECKIKFNVADIETWHVNEDSQGTGYGLIAVSDSTSLSVVLDVFDLPGMRNDSLEITFSSTNTSGEAECEYMRII